MKSLLFDVRNPFSTRFVRPGAIEYLFPGGWSAQRLINELAANAWRGAIVGPHGSGKSTLLAALLPRLDECGVRSHLITLHDGQRWLPRMSAPLQWNNRDGEDLKSRQLPTFLLVIDGYEQLNFLSRWILTYTCRWRGWGLLVTSHQSVALPTIFESMPSLGVLQEVLERLLPPDVAILTPDDAADAYAKSGGNLREALFDLYDRFEQRHWGSPNRRLLSAV